tara:strand:+ start:4067 stop:5122 length:1056 start_codon:yes stop_codon:yes gene_type:complete
MKKIVIITGSGGLIGSEAVKFFEKKKFEILGIDNNKREYFFGKDGSVKNNISFLKNNIKNYSHLNFDIRNKKKIFSLFKKYKNDIKCIIHTAAQPSHDWAAKEPHTDFEINANSTLHLLEATRLFSKKAVFIFTSTNKVYGDNPNALPLVEYPKRLEIKKNHKYFKNGIDENMSIDMTTHSLFGTSKVAADILVQEYGRYFQMKTVCFRGGCLTGPSHSGAMLHGFLSYLVKCAVRKKTYTIIGNRGKQVRDNIHSEDLIRMFWMFYKKPKQGEVYNVGGSRYSNCSILEAIDLIEKKLGYKMKIKYKNSPRIGDHKWWISDITKFRKHFPKWKYLYNVNDIIDHIINNEK